MIYDKKNNKYCTKEDILKRKMKEHNEKIELHKKTNELLGQILQVLENIKESLNNGDDKNGQSTK